MNQVHLSAAESEYCNLFTRAVKSIDVVLATESYGFPQPPCRIRTDNEAAEGICNGTYQMKRTRSINTKFHWINERTAQGQFQIEWFKGSENLADHFTKALPRIAFRKIQVQLVHYPKSDVIRDTARSRKIARHISKGES